MLFLTIVIYFFIASVGVGLVAFPTFRATLADTLVRRTKFFGLAFLRVTKNWQCGLHRARRQTIPFANGVKVMAQRNSIAVIAGALLLSLPPVVMISAGHRSTFESYTIINAARNEHVTTLLHGEQLTPPPSLPPLLFTTPDLAQAHPMLSSASRSWQLLDPDFAQRLLHVFKLMQERHGYQMVMLEGYRSPQRQAMLASIGTHVTKAGAFQSFHQFGLAADAAFLRDGKLVISEKDEWAMRGYRLYGEISVELGLEWGGVWKMRDFGHVELRKTEVAKN